MIFHFIICVKAQMCLGDGSAGGDSGIRLPNAGAVRADAGDLGCRDDDSERKGLDAVIFRAGARDDGRPVVDTDDGSLHSAAEGHGDEPTDAGAGRPDHECASDTDADVPQFFIVVAGGDAAAVAAAVCVWRVQCCVDVDTAALPLPGCQLIGGPQPGPGSVRHYHAGFTLVLSFYTPSAAQEKRRERARRCGR